MRFYTTPAGEKYPLTEARYEMTFKAYRSDRRKAVAGDPGRCLLALGIRRDPQVADVYIGSGKDAYVILKETQEHPAQAVHFTIRTPAKRIRDGWDKDKSAVTQLITLSRPAISQTVEAQRAYTRRRREEIKNGAPVKHRGPNKGHRMTRLGVPHRPRPKISRGGSVSMQEPAATA
jgi:hypothetical protein